MGRMTPSTPLLLMIFLIVVTTDLSIVKASLTQPVGPNPPQIAFIKHYIIDNSNET